MVSAVFVGAAGNTSPTVTLTSPANGTAFTAPATIGYGATAADVNGTVTRVEFYANNSLVGTDTTGPSYTFNWAGVPAGKYSLTAVAFDDDLASTTSSAPVVVTVNAPAGGGASAAFVGVDSSRQGNWIGAYGAEGHAIVGESTSLPAYATLAPVGASSYTWAASTADPRGLQRTGGSGRLAATWYSPTSFDVDVNLTDATLHQVAFYVLDWDTTKRAQRIDVLDATTSVVLDSRTLSGFNGGQYVVWNLRGHVKLRFTRTGGVNAVLSGVFFGAGGGGGTPGSAATFAGLDSTTQGTWLSSYGSDGYNIFNDAVSYPAYATVTATGQSVYTWAGATSDPRGLQRPGGGARIAATWYSETSFDIDLNLAGSQAHDVSFYAVDWDNQVRTQRFDVLDATTLAVLDTRTISGFQNGVYLTWTMTGPVKIRVTRTGGANAVVSGIFFDPAGGQ